ncbi:hypothetical protein BJ912DRAFT_959739 [Pholiota molesta]|nr:hypothetical protein BJ912DRAFT_959739 [Pholiota molesta]
MLSVLPATLIALLFVLPTLAQSTSSNDPFRALALHVPKLKQPDNPICCLKPVTPSEPVDDGILLSFEEWKAKQSNMQTPESSGASSGGGDVNFGGDAGNASDTGVSPTDNTGSAGSVEAAQATPEYTDFALYLNMIPTTDRFNYASLDCSARSATSILSSKRDRYMLSPCDTKEQQYVVVELCDDIRIDTVQLANFEFFKHRGVQTFHPPASLRDFVRFIRIDFHSHYGNEFYCPVSLLRVYGLTHLEEWKRDIWESEGRAKQAELQKKRQLPVSAEAPIPTIAPKIADPIPEARSNSQPLTEETVVPTITAHIPNYPSATEGSDTPPSLSVTDPTTFLRKPQSTKPEPGAYSHSFNDSYKHSTDTYVTTPIITPPIPTQSTPQDNIPTSEKVVNTTQNISHASSSSSYTPQSSPVAPHSDTSTVVISSTSPSVAIIPIVPQPPVTKGGESIYRTILNRLAEVEINQTLYMQDVGRLEGIKLDSWQRQRSQLESDYVDLVFRVEHLCPRETLGVAQLCLLLAVLVFMGLTRGSRAEALIDHGSSRLNRSVREWGGRHFRLSGSWAGRFKGKNLEIRTSRRNSPSSSRSTSRTRTPQTSTRPKPISAKSYPPQPPSRSQNGNDTFHFPSSSSSKMPLDPININTAPIGTEYFIRPRTISNPRSRAPSLRSTPANRRLHLQRPVTPVTASFRPQHLQRSNSHGGPLLPQSASWGAVSVPKSAKRWARSAHLHEVKTLGPLVSAATAAAAAAATSARRSRKKSGENSGRTPREFDFERENHDFFSSSAGSLLFKADDESAASVALDEGDVWIDTDSIDGSELDAEQTRNITSLTHLPS